MKKRNDSRSYLLLVILFSFAIHFSGLGQKPEQPDAAKLMLKIKKLNVLGNVLYFAAHPDDENTRLIAYLANGELLNTGYMALTRGDGGQNLIGPEIREQLGVIRTQELLQARRTDGGQQFFSRANDFGYSKSAAETLEIWGKDDILADAVWVIRNFKPDVIITRFPPDSRAGHGHHTSSAMLAIEAFDIAGRSDIYPEQLKYTETWQPKNLFVNTGRWWRDKISEDEDSVYVIDVGQYSTLLGKSYTEIAALSRSMHKSQGFGATGSRGESLEYLEYKKGDMPKEKPFDLIDFTWNRVQYGKRYQSQINAIIDAFNPTNPGASIPSLIDLHTSLDDLADDFWRQRKQDEIESIIKDCLGLFIEAKADNYYATPGSNINIDLEMISRVEANIKINHVEIKGTEDLIIVNKKLEANKELTHEFEISIPENFEVSQPYWLKDEGTYGKFAVEDQLLIGTPENKPALLANFKFEISGLKLDYKVPVIYKQNDPVKGEVYQPFVIAPPVGVNALSDVVIFTGNEARDVSFKVISMTDSLTGNLEFQVPVGWKIQPASQDIGLLSKGDEQTFTVRVTAPENEDVSQLKPIVKYAGKNYDRGIQFISYDHIPTQVLFAHTLTKLVKLEIQKVGNKIGYIMGAGDEVPGSLEQIGYEVSLLNDEDIIYDQLSQFDAIILGVRALNTNERIKYYMDDLLLFVKNGGNLIIQYNTAHRLKTEDFAPYPLKLGRDRVSEEDAVVTFLNTDHPVMNQPNAISKKDFDGWVQERGLYFPQEWSEEYETILSWHDNEEETKESSLLIAKYGKGNFIYTGISFFRQLPAGVPGAYRLFANMISIGLNTEQTPRYHSN